MQDESRHYLRVLHDAIEALLRTTAQVSYVQLMEQPEARQRVFMPLLDLIELNSSVVPTLRSQHPELPWDALSHLKGVVTHQYFGMEYGQHWATLLDELPTLANAIAGLISNR